MFEMSLNFAMFISNIHKPHPFFARGMAYCLVSVTAYSNRNFIEGMAGNSSAAKLSVSLY
jgi:hypothetical protein